MIPLPSKPKVIEKKTNWALFEVGGLYPGYGATLGNALRRVLLSSLVGAAITQVKIRGAQHEFSTLPGVLEDVLSITLNLKQLKFKLFGEEPQKITLSAKREKREKEIKGSDFKLPTQVELINPEAHIATLTGKSAHLEMEAKVEKGLGYQPVETRKKEKVEIGMIPIDAIFTPVRRVAYRVENMRVGERTDYDKLFLEIETDGTLNPEEAFSEASEVLVKYFSLFVAEPSPKPNSKTGSKKKSQA